MDRRLDALVAELGEQEVVEHDIELGEQLTVGSLHRLLLLGQRLLEPRDQAVAGALRDDRYRLAFEGTADEHRLAARGDVDPAHPRPALRQDFDEAFVGQPSERLRDGKTRRPQALAQRLLLDELAGREGEADDRLADGVLDALHGSTASVPR